MVSRDTTTAQLSRAGDGLCFSRPMVMRSARLEQIFDGPLDTLKTSQVRSLVQGSVAEAFDLDFKETLYGRADADKRSLAVDVAALANTAGGAIVLGIGEDDHARASTATGVELSDDEERRMRQVVASLVAPVPTFDIFPVADTTTSGFYVLAVTRSAGAPHAVIVGEGLRYPKRNGATTRYLSEPEVAEAYRLRLAGLGAQENRLDDVWRTGTGHLDIQEVVWVGVALVPGLPGEIRIDRAAYTEFERSSRLNNPTIVSLGRTVQRATVGPGYMSADGGGSRRDSSYSKWLAFDLHTDGSGFYALAAGRVNAQTRSDGGQLDIVILDDELLTIAILSGLALLGRHAGVGAAASGDTILRAGIYQPRGDMPVELGYSRQHGLPETYDRARVLTTEPPPVVTAASLDALAIPGPDLIAVGARICHALGQVFGVSELGQLTADGEIRCRYFDSPTRRRAGMQAWASSIGVTLTEEVLP
jgi:hypothetical protein